MSNNYLRFGYFVTWLAMGFSLLAWFFIAVLLIGNLFGWIPSEEWLSVSANGDIAIWFLGDVPSGFQLPDWSIYFILFRFMFVVGVWVFILKLLQLVLQSVKDLKTFQVENIKNFRKLGFGFLMLAAIDLISLSPSPDSFRITFSLGLTYFLLAAAAFLLSEVFKEGNELYEQNRLMI